MSHASPSATKYASQILVFRGRSPKSQGTTCRSIFVWCITPTEQALHFICGSQKLATDFNKWGHSLSCTLFVSQMNPRDCSQRAKCDIWQNALYTWCQNVRLAMSAGHTEKLLVLQHYCQLFLTNFFIAYIIILAYKSICITSKASADISIFANFIRPDAQTWCTGAYYKFHGYLKCGTRCHIVVDPPGLWPLSNVL